MKYWNPWVDSFRNIWCRGYKQCIYQYCFSWSNVVIQIHRWIFRISKSRSNVFVIYCIKTYSNLTVVVAFCKGRLDSPKNKVSSYLTLYIVLHTPRHLAHIYKKNKHKFSLKIYVPNMKNYVQVKKEENLSCRMLGLEWDYCTFWELTFHIYFRQSANGTKPCERGMTIAMLLQKFRDNTKKRSRKSTKQWLLGLRLVGELGDERQTLQETHRDIEPSTAKKMFLSKFDKLFLIWLIISYFKRDSL